MTVILASFHGTDSLPNPDYATVAAQMATDTWFMLLIGSFLFGTEPRDPAAISAVVVMLLLVAAVACWAPARRASRIDPMAALRNE